MREMTSERFRTKGNEQILKEVKPQEVNSLVQTPRSDDPVSGNRLRDCVRRFENTGEGCPIYKSLRKCIILEKSLYWNELQDHRRRR